MKKLKLIGKEIVAVVIVGFGVKFVSIYLTNELDLISIIAGLIGFAILTPAVHEYVNIIDKILNGEE